MYACLGRIKDVYINSRGIFFTISYFIILITIRAYLGVCSIIQHLYNQLNSRDKFGWRVCGAVLHWKTRQSIVHTINVRSGLNMAISGAIGEHDFSSIYSATSIYLFLFPPFKWICLDNILPISVLMNIVLITPFFRCFLCFSFFTITFYFFKSSIPPGLLLWPQMTNLL